MISSPVSTFVRVMHSKPMASMLCAKLLEALDYGGSQSKREHFPQRGAFRGT